LTNVETITSCNLCGNNQLEIIDSDKRICRCRICGYIFDNPRPAFKDLVLFYSQLDKYDDWLENEESRDRLWIRRLRKMERYKKHGTLLDIGTGTGQFLHHASNYYTVTYGTEISDSAIAIAEKKYGIKVEKGELHEINFKDTSFDNITMFHVLEHLPYPLRAIQKCHDLLVNDGIFFIAVPNDIISLKAKLKAALSKLGVKRFRNIGKLGLPQITLDGSLPEIHLSHFTPQALCNVLEKCGFEVIDDSLDPYFASRGIKKLIMNVFYYFAYSYSMIFKRNIYDTIWIAAKK